MCILLVSLQTKFLLQRQSISAQKVWKSTDKSMPFRMHTRTESVGYLSRSLYLLLVGFALFKWIEAMWLVHIFDIGVYFLDKIIVIYLIPLSTFFNMDFTLDNVDFHTFWAAFVKINQKAKPYLYMLQAAFKISCCPWHDVIW